MALEKKQLLKLMKLAATADPASPTAYAFGEEKFSYGDLDAAVHKELTELAGSHTLYRRNKDLIFELIEETIDDVLPKKVLEQYGAFAEVKVLAQGDKPVFRQRITEAARVRAKQFVTKVGLAGTYEVFKLDGRTLELEIMAYGGAAEIGLEEFLDGRITFADVLDIVLEGLDEAVYREIARAFVAGISALPVANTSSASSFDEAEMDRLVQTADAYGQAAIYCTYEHAATIVPSDGWISDAIRDTKWNVGYLANYKGHKVIILPQSFTDTTNDTKVIDPSFAWIVPVGADKPVKIAFEGQTITREYDNRDGSKEIQVYKKIGVGTLMTNNICVYENTSLTTDNTPAGHTPIQ